jgi:hypothetical protein
MNDGFPTAGYQPESYRAAEEQPLSQLQQYQQQQQQQQHIAGAGGFRYPARPERSKSKEDRSERKHRYDRMEALTRELSMAIRDEMERRKALWDVEGDREEEEFWESRKQEVYQGLEVLADDLQRAFRDRKKEAVMAYWSNEQEQRRLLANASRPERSRRSSRRDEG